MNYISNTYKNNTTKLEHMKVLDDYGPYRFFLTLTFNHLLTEKAAQEMANIFWRRLNRKLFRKDDVYLTDGFRGVAVMEKRSIIRGKSMTRNCHFHFLIKDNPRLITYERTEKEQITEFCIKTTRTFKTANGHTLVSQNAQGCMVKDVYDSQKLVDYCLKDTGEPRWSASDRLYFLDRQGLLAFADDGTVTPFSGFTGQESIPQTKSWAWKDQDPKPVH